MSEPVAYRWRVKGAETWVYDPTPDWIAAQRLRSDIDIEPLYAAPQAAPAEDVALPAGIAEIEAGVQLDASAAANETGLTERLRGPAFGTPTALQAADAIDKLQADVETWKTRAERLADMHRDMCVVAGETEARATTSEAEATSLRRKLEEARKALWTARKSIETGFGTLQAIAAIDRTLSGASE